MSNMALNLIVKASTESASAKFKNLGDDIKNLDKDAKNGASGAEQFATKLNNVGGKAQAVGGKLTRSLTVPITGIGVAAAKTAMGFEAEMSKVQAISGASGDQMKKLTDKAKEMGAKTKFSASESAEAFEYMAMAGWKTDEMLGGIEGMMNLAAASGADLATTSDIVTDALTAFGKSAKDSGRLADIMAAASSNANTNVEMMGATFKYAAPVAGALGYSMEDTALATGLMANAGIKAEKAGTALRGGLTNLAKPTEQMQKAMDEYGISLTDNEGNMKSLRDVMGDLRTKLGGLSEDEQAAAVSAIFGKEAMSGWLAVVNASDKDFDKLSGAIDDSNGKAKEMSDTMMDNAEGSLIKMKSALEGAAIELGENFAPWVEKGAEKITDMAEKFSKLDEKTQGFIIKAGLAVAAAGPMISMFGKTATGISGVIKLTGTVTSGIANIGTGMSDAAGKTGGLTKNMGLLAGVINPVTVAAGLLAVEVGVGAKALYDAYQETHKYRIENEKFIETQQKGIEEIDAQNGVIDDYRDKLYYLLNEENKSANEKKRIHYYVDKLNEIIPDLNASYDEERDAVDTLNGTLSENIENYKEQATAKAYAAQAEEIVAKQIENEEALNQKYLERAALEQKLAEAEQLKNMGNGTRYSELLKEMETVDTQIEELMDANEKLGISFDAVSEKAENPYARTIETYELLKLQAEEAGVKIPEALDKSIRDGTTKIPDSIVELQALMDPKYKALVDEASKYGVEATNEISDGLKTGQYTVEQASAALFRIITANGGDAQKVLTKAGVDTPKAYAFGLKNNKAYVKDAFKYFSEYPNANFNNALSDAEKYGVKIPETLANKIKQTKSPEEAAKLLREHVEKEIKKTPAKAKTQGENTGYGFAKGMGSEGVLSSVGEKAESLASRALEKMKSFLDINSPSKETARVGLFFAQGFAKGMSDRSGLNAIRQASGALGKEALSSLNAGGFSPLDGGSLSQVHTVNQSMSVSSVGTITNETDSVAAAVMALAPYIAKGVNDGIDNLTLEIDGREFGRMVERYA